ncbi:exocyst subunit [Tilletia horrida]|uniref:Exocyst complex component Sec8 n=1 Tax=Tilletia horrida TaxID=155126 RepID=A0AAN6GPV4_9BASI|nr:exocyst subunit [Tilletia horrida]
MSRSGPRDVRSRIRHENAHLGEGTEYRQPASNPGQQQQQQQAQQYQTQQQYQYGNTSNGYDAYGQHQQGYGHHQQSTSISQYGAAGHGSTSYSQAPSSSQAYGERPSYESGVYGGTNDANAGSASGPLRPARSVRRPLQPPALEPHLQSRSPHSDNSRSNSRPRDAAYYRLQGNDQSENDSSGHGHGDLNQYEHYEMEEPPAAPAAPVGSLTAPKSPHLLNSAVSALSAAARKQQANRVMRGTTAEEETQRRRNERKIHDMRDVQARPVEHYMSRNDEGNFRYINAVLRKAKAEWPLFGEDEFNHVAMALSLLDNSSLGSSYETFNQMKVTLEDSLQGTVDDHYESFATAITNHNSVLSALSSAQAGVQQAAKRLRDSREALGVRRADLVQMWQRAQSVKEAIDLLDILDSLRAVPEHLETLIADKRFLQAVNLLNRAMKTIAKPEIEEIGASSDLRAYLKGQETAILDILIEELHNHLYLKSTACDVRWKAYTPGQDKLPEVEFGIDLEKLEAGASSERQTGSSDGPDKLTRYLHALDQHPNFSTAPENDLADLALPQSASMTSNFPSDVPGSVALTASKSMDSTFSLTGASNDGHTFFDSDDALDRYEKNPEMDSFLYIEMILESLAKLGNLGFALEVVTQRLPIELHALVDTTIEQVDQRNTALRAYSLALRPESLILSSSSALARSFATDPLGKSDSFRSSFSNIAGDRPLSTLMRMTAVESSALQRDTETMRDLFWTLFSKMDAVLQGHRVLFEVVSRILQRPPGRNQPDERDIKLGSLMDVWKPIESEVRMLLHDHLLDESQSSSAARNASISVNEVLRDSKFGRDRSKKLFKLADSNTKTAKSNSLKLLRKHEDALSNTLRDSLPVLMGTPTGNGQGPTSNSQGASILDNAQVQQHIIISSIRSESQQHTGMGHRLLVKPDAFNVSVLFQPTLAFLSRVEAVIPGDVKNKGSVKFGGFVDEFVRRIFLPQLEDRVQSLFATATGGLDAFQEDPASRQIARKPIVKSVGNVIVLIDSLYSMLRATPFHRESYSRLIIQTIAQYYQRCNGRFKEIASSDHDAVPRGDGPQSPYVLSATWAQRPELKACLVELLQLESGSERVAELQAQENRFEMLYAQQAGGIRFTDLITSRKKLTALANLHHSLRFFIDHTSRLKATENYKGTAVQNPTARLSIMGRSGMKSAADALQLPMDQDMARRFEALPDTFRNFGNTILFTLRLELRARAIHFIDLALHEGTYLVDSGTLEPDSHVVDLNVELASCDDVLIQALAPEQHSFLFNGLASLMDSLLITGVRRVRAMNKPGATKMMRNIMALQQNLKNIVEDPLEVDFEHSRRFWELLMKEPDQYMDSIKAMGTRHSFEEYKSALHLMLGLENASSAASSSQGPVPSSFAGAGILGSGSRDVSRQKYNEYLIELHEIVADISE